MDTVSQKVRGFLGSTANLISPIKDYEVKDQISSTKFYKIHESIKKTSNEDCSIFIFDKKGFEKQNSSLSKVNLESVHGFVKREAQQLQRLRHPSILNVVGVLEDTKTHIYFSTEPILASLEDLIRNFKARKSSKRDSGSITEDGYKVKDFTFEELEVKSGVFQVLEGLHFLNSTAKLLHRSISPQSIFITRGLKWKLAGLGLSCPIETANSEPIPGLSIVDFHEYQYPEPSSTLPNLDYLPPEFIFEKKFDYNSDLFSIGRLIYELSLLSGDFGSNSSSDDDSRAIIKLGTIQYYKMKLEEIKMKTNQLNSRNDSAKVCSILLGDTSLRGNLENFFKSAYFQDILTKSMVYLVNITQKEDESKLQFYRGLFNILPQFSARIQTNYILPVLLSDLVNERVVYVSLPCILTISTNHVKKETFQSKVIPSLIPIFQSKEPKAEVLSTILNNINLFMNKASVDQIKQLLLPIILGTLCGPTQEIIFQCLSNANVIFKVLDSDVIGAGVIPRLTNLISNAFPIHIRSNAIHWLTQLVPVMDKKIVIDILIPNLERIISNDNSPQILEAMVQTYSAISKKLGGELLALKVLPALMQISADKHLDIQQFQSIMKVVKEILTTYESERLNELNNLQRYTKKVENQSPNDKIMEQFSNTIDSPNLSHNTKNNNNSQPSSQPSLQPQPPIKISLPPSPINTINQSSSSSINNQSNPFNNFVSVNSPQSTNSVPVSGGSVNKSFLDSPDFTSFGGTNTYNNINTNNNNNNNNFSIPPPNSIGMNKSNSLNSFSNFDVLQPNIGNGAIKPILNSGSSSNNFSLNNHTNTNNSNKYNISLSPMNNTNQIDNSIIKPQNTFNSNNINSNINNNLQPKQTYNQHPTFQPQPLQPTSNKSSTPNYNSYTPNYNLNENLDSSTFETLQPNNNNKMGFNNNNYLNNFGNKDLIQPTNSMFNQMNLNNNNNGTIGINNNNNNYNNFNNNFNNSMPNFGNDLIQPTNSMYNQMNLNNNNGGTTSNSFNNKW